jgi:hypothetical protein
MNFWHWLIQNLIGGLYGLMVGAGLVPPHQQWGLAAAVVGYGGELLIISITFMGAFIRLRTLAFVLGLIALMWLWSNKGKVLSLIAMVRFFL